MDALLDRALIEEAAKKSALLWVRAADDAADRALWHIWHDGAAVVVGDGAEQPLHGLTAGATVTVTLRSKDTWGRILAFPATVEELEPRGERWQAAVAELRGKRLNAPDHETMADRWARESRVLRLAPDGPSTEHPGSLPDVSHAAPPLPTEAQTRRPVPPALPRLLLRRERRRKQG
jgi:hypothetical protein